MTQVALSFLFLAMLSPAFLLAAIPAFLTALLAAKFRYTRYNIASIVLVSSIISFVYCNMASYFYLLLLGEQDTSFWGWLTEGGIVPSG
ncbi:Uncharacterised protein [Haemophilus influenzae]|uniref:Uncharacterized protein n=1 Tax=Haemophilus influenzae TaxID=727 RepID=A0A2X1RPT2_HAEIF|nr:Uncharacterised protein [Haemophilus influenzae]